MTTLTKIIHIVIEPAIRLIVVLAVVTLAGFIFFMEHDNAKRCEQPRVSQQESGKHP